MNKKLRTHCWLRQLESWLLLTLQLLKFIIWKLGYFKLVVQIFDESKQLRFVIICRLIYCFNA